MHDDKNGHPLVRPMIGWGPPIKTNIDYTTVYALFFHAVCLSERQICYHLGRPVQMIKLQAFNFQNIKYYVYKI